MKNRNHTLEKRGIHKNPRNNKERKIRPPVDEAARKKRREKRRKWLWIITSGILVSIVLSVAAIWLIDFRVESIGKKRVVAIADLTDGYDCVIVPGAAVYRNSIPSAMLQDRLDVAIELYQKKIVPKILVSGDHGKENYDEVSVMRNYLVGRGIPTEDIFMDYAGFDTYQTIYRARDVFLVRRAVLTTQDFHLYRALYIAEKLSVEMDGVDSALRNYYNSSWNRAREYLARVKAFIECEILKPEPDFLGEVIPITGGAQTDIDK